MLAAVQDNAQALTTTPRRPTGQFVPGISGNPGGKRKTPPDIKALAQNYTREMVETAVEIMRDDEQTGAARMQALGWLSDRAFGRAPITVDPEAANSLGASFVALLDQVAREHQPRVATEQLIDFTPESVTDDEPAK